MNNQNSTLSANASVFVPGARPSQPEEKRVKPASLDPSWIIRSRQYQISNKNIQQAMYDPSWGDQEYVWMDASNAKTVLGTDKSLTLPYVLAQREFYKTKGTSFTRHLSDIAYISMMAGYIEEDGDVAYHEFGMFSIPYYFLGMDGSTIRLGDVVPEEKLKITHRSPGNQIKAHNTQDLLFLSYIDPSEFKSVVTATKLAAHSLYMSKKGIYGYTRPKWTTTTDGLEHMATVVHGAPYEDVVLAIEDALTDSDGKFDRRKYNRIIRDCTVRRTYDHFDGNEVAIWRHNQHYDKHKHKFPLDLVMMEKYETIMYLQYTKKTIGHLSEEEAKSLKDLLAETNWDPQDSKPKGKPAHVANIMDFMKKINLRDK